jgi:hypothetical protein
MRKKLEIDFAAATFPDRFGKSLALKLGFSTSEWVELWWLARYPDRVKHEFDEARMGKLLDLILRDPKAAGRLMAAIQQDRDRKENSAMRSVLLRNWSKPDKEIASLLCEKLNQTKLAGKALAQRIENVKKQRQNLAKRYPRKGKTTASQLPLG